MKNPQITGIKYIFFYVGYFLPFLQQTVSIQGFCGTTTKSAQSEI